jgi:hypothetical protein
MAVCITCQEFETERTSLRELVGGIEPVIAPPDFDMRLRARIAAEKYDRRRQPFFARLVTTPALAAAALFVLVAGSVFWISRRPSIPTVDVSRPEVARNGVPKAPSTVTPHNEVVTTPTSNEGENVAPASEDDTHVARSNGSHRNRGSRVMSAEDSLVRGAESIRQTDLDQDYVPSRPVEFALQDERGKTRKISLPPVSFGAQNLVSDTRTNVSYSPSSRVW